MSQENVEHPEYILRGRAFVAVLVLAAVVGVIASLAAWCFLELIFYIQRWVFTDIPMDLGYDHGAPLWWYLPVLVFAGLVSAIAIALMQGRGGHIPAEGLDRSPIPPIGLPSVMNAGYSLDSLGPVMSPEAPLITLGGGRELTIQSLRRDAPPQLATLLASSGALQLLASSMDRSSVPLF